MTSRRFRLAHFSDLHLDAIDDELDWTVRMVDDALARGAGHIAFTGDIVDAAQMDVFIALFRKLGGKGLDARRLSFVPGNHDIYPFSWEHGFEDESLLDCMSRSLRNAHRAGNGLREYAARRADRAFRQVSRLSDKLNGSDARLFRDIAFPYGKRLSRDVALAGIDTTRCATPDASFNDIATGELPGEHIDKVQEFFSEHAAATHRVVLMHHYPLDDFTSDSGLVPMKFIEPSAATVRNWLGWAGATTVLCGHIHEERRRRARDGFEVITSDSSCYELVRGGTGRAYTLVDLLPSGHVDIERVRLEEGRRSFVE